MSVNKKRKDLSVTEKLRLIDTYEKLNLRSSSQREVSAKLESASVKFIKIVNTL
jgi:hypothetical protein